MQDGTPVRQYRTNLAALNAPDFHVILRHHESGNLRVFADGREVVHLRVAQDPSDARRNRRFRHARQSRRAHWLEKYAIGPRLRSRLHQFQQLLALQHRIVLGDKHLEFHSQPIRGAAPFDLIT